VGGRKEEGRAKEDGKAFLSFSFWTDFSGDEIGSLVSLAKPAIPTNIFSELVLHLRLLLSISSCYF